MISGTAQASADSIRAVLSSPSTCTPATPTILSELLLPSKPIVQDANPKSKNATTTAKSKATKPLSTKSKSRKGGEDGDANKLSPKEAYTLATEVVNATLKYLGDALKAPAQVSARRQASSKDLVKAASRQTLRRSNSLPQSPLQPRSLNRVISSPDIRHRRSSSVASNTSLTHRPMAECARVGFAALRALQSSGLSGMDLPALQLESGMSALIGKLASLGLDDLALKELRILKRRLECSESVKVPKGTKATFVSNLPVPTLAGLLDFSGVELTGTKLGLAITTQMQVLQLMTSGRKPKLVEESLPILKLNHPSSPIRLLMLATEGSPTPKQKEKYARLLERLSGLLLSLCPSLSSSDDALALDARLSVKPEVAVQIQSLALHSRFSWWSIAGHQGDLSKDIFEPLLRCLSTFSRRSQSGMDETCSVAISATSELLSLSSLTDCSKIQPLKSALAGIYSLLGSLARGANRIEEAIKWTEYRRELLDDRVDSDAKRTALNATLLGLLLRNRNLGSECEDLFFSLLEALDRPFKGESSEIEELLDEVSATRRSAIGTLSQFRKSSGPDSSLLGDGLRQMCETLVLLCPRLALRYLGNAPDAKSTVKDTLRYEQRRQFITPISLHSIDSTLLLVKTLAGEDLIEWDLVDSKLQDCLLLLDRLEPNGLDDDSGPMTHYMRISNLYFTQFLNMQRKQDVKMGQQLRAVRRSIDCIRARPEHEKRNAHFIMKLERMAGICKLLGRFDEVYQTLLLMQAEMVQDGILSTTAEDADSKPFDTVWGASDQSRMFARNLESLLKIDMKHIDPPGQGKLVEETWSQNEQAAVLEYQLEVLCKRFNDSEIVKATQRKVLSDLLAIYDERYPLRRTRVFTKLLGLDLNYSEEVSELLQKHLKFLQDQKLILENTSDEGLQRYADYYKNTFAVAFQIRQRQPDIEVFEQSLLFWSTSRTRCPNLALLGQEIEDVPELLVQLQMTTDYLNMKGQDTLALVASRLKVDLHEICESLIDPDEKVVSLVSLGNQWLHLGYTGKAGLVLDKATSFCSRNGVTSYAKLLCKLTYCEYLLGLGGHEKAQETLNSAQELYTLATAEFSTSQPSLTSRDQIKMELLVSRAYMIHSMLAHERGAAHTALNQAKQGVKLLRHAWAVIEKLERRSMPRDIGAVPKDVDKLTEDLSHLNLSTISIAVPQQPEELPITNGLWALVPSLFQGLSRLSQLYAHNGMSQEMIYYAEQSNKVAEIAHSETYKIMASVNLGNAWLRCGVLDKGSEYLMNANKLCQPKSATREQATLSYHLGIMHGLLGDSDSQIEAFNAAEETLRTIIKADHIGGLDKVENGADIMQKKAETVVTKPKAKTAAPRKAATRAKPNPKTKTVARVTLPAEPVTSLVEECRQLTSFLANVLRQKAGVLIASKATSMADAVLEEAARYTHTQIDVIHQGLATAKQWLLLSLEQMNADPVYSVLQDSTISFPSILGQTKAEKLGDRLSIVKPSPPPKSQGKANRGRNGAKSPAPGSFSDRLRQAYELLTEIHSTSIHVASLPVINKVSALLNTVSILLSAVQAKGPMLASPGLASSSVENARTLALRRARKAILLDPYAALRSSDVTWPQTALRDSRRSSIALPSDMFRFQKDYVDIIPKSWTVVSVSLGDNSQELCISKLQAGHNPFILRLPLGRHNSMDADEEVFGFEQGHSELLEILTLANESSHVAATRTSREDKTAWWDEREALDARLRDLLENVEKVWLGGFTGIFSQHTRRPDLLARFQKSFTNILDRHLPSRRKTGRKTTKTTSPRITLDTRILDLFIGLGDASDEECDLSEPLTDLLNFVVDVLQFHGEYNAYAEIDFDLIVVETYDALRAYHTAFNSIGHTQEDRHTILVLDKALHSIPWESLPCMDGLSVSRVPSLGCLRDRILAQQETTNGHTKEGHYISRDEGSYILNPEGDLKNTQSTFQKDLENLEDWTGITNRIPSEEEFKKQLIAKEMLLYFGHGSGAQYIRAREIRKLEKCAVTMLMGCSSGALTEAGEFEPYGPPINYMHAGCPALVATLWDVTDKDIDRFAKSTFEHWGLMGAGSHTKGKSKKKVEESRENVSLAEAVAKSRAACNLRYLNGAAVCIYGVPVYLE